MFASGQKKEALAEEKLAFNLLSDAYTLQAEEVALQRDEQGGMLEELGRIDEARQSYESGRSARTLIDTENPRGLISDVRLAALVSREGRPRDAVRAIERALGRLERLYGKADPLLIWPLRKLAQARVEARDFAAALRALERARTIVESTHGHLSPLAGAIRTQMGEICRLRGDHKAALAHFDEAVLPVSSAFGSEHARNDANVLSRAELAHLLGQREYSERLFGVALSGIEKRLGPQHPSAVALRARIAKLGVRAQAP